MDWMKIAVCVFVGLVVCLLLVGIGTHIGKNIAFEHCSELSDNGFAIKVVVVSQSDMLLKVQKQYLDELRRKGWVQVSSRIGTSETYYVLRRKQ